MARRVSIALLFLIAGFLHCFGTTAYGQNAGEEQRLRKEERQLTEKVRKLQAEQERLLLRKALASSDSKYLLLDLRRGEGILKYRMRTLRTFRFAVRGKRPDRTEEIMALSLMSKEDAVKRLTFGDMLRIESRPSHRSAGAGVSLVMAKRDRAALYYALDVGSIAFLSGP